MNRRGVDCGALQLLFMLVAGGSFAACSAAAANETADKVPDVAAEDAAAPDAARALCTSTCDPGYHLCGDECAPNGDPKACGSSCMACAAPANGDAVCLAGVCGFNCLTGFHPCGGSCVGEDDVHACGTACVACPSGASCARGVCVPSAAAESLTMDTAVAHSARN